MKAQDQDLFENPELLPAEVQEIIDSIAIAPTYCDLERALKKIQALGYTFDYGLDAVPYDLQRI